MSFVKKIVILIFALCVIFIVCVMSLTVTLIINTSLILEYPAAVYKIGDIIDNEYIVVATDSYNTLWLKKCNESHTYIAFVSSDYPNLSFFEKVKWLKKHRSTSLKDSVCIEITAQAEPGMIVCLNEGDDNL